MGNSSAKNHSEDPGDDPLAYQTVEGDSPAVVRCQPRTATPLADENTNPFALFSPGAPGQAAASHDTPVAMSKHAMRNKAQLGSAGPSAFALFSPGVHRSPRSMGSMGSPAQRTPGSFPAGASSSCAVGAGGVKPHQRTPLGASKLSSNVSRTAEGATQGTPSPHACTNLLRQHSASPVASCGRRDQSPLLASADQV